MALKTRPFIKGEQLWADAIKLIPTGTQTLSKMPNQFAEGLSPKFFVKGKGAYLWDPDGNKFLDFAGALGPIILGYHHPDVNRAIQNQLKKGIIFSLGNPLEIELASLLTRFIPSAEMVKFGKNGNDVTSASIRLARAVTGRNHIALCGYHGWQDWYIATTNFDKGIPESIKDLSSAFKFNDIESLESCLNSHKGEIAAVIIEPAGANKPKPGFLAKVQEITHKHGALLIFDEIKTGFRCHLGGAQALFRVTPDLSCFGKAIANGMPMSALVGRREVMQQCDSIFFSMQAGGELLSIAAAIATITILANSGILDAVRKQGLFLEESLNMLIQQYKLSAYLKVTGLPHYLVLQFHHPDQQLNKTIKTLFIQECVTRGVFCGGYFILSAAHTRLIIEKSLKVFTSTFRNIAKALNSKSPLQFLRCPLVGEVFRTL